MRINLLLSAGYAAENHYHIVSIFNLIIEYWFAQTGKGCVGGVPWPPTTSSIGEKRSVGGMEGFTLSLARIRRHYSRLMTI